MKKTILFLLLMSISTIALYAQFDDVSAEYKEEVIAVYPFSDNSSRWTDEGNALTDRVIDTLVNLKRFKIVDRDNIDRVFAEMELQLSGITSEEAIEVGKTYGYSKAITGSIVNVLTVIDQANRKAIAEITLSVRIIDIETSEIIESKTIKLSSSAPIRSFNTADARREALSGTYDLVANEIIDMMRDVFKITISVTGVRGDDVYLMVGENAGVKKNWKFKIYDGKGEPIYGPNDEILAIDRKYKGTVKVNRVQDNFTIANSVRGATPVEGDIAEELPLTGGRTSLLFTYSLMNYEGFDKTIKYRDATGKDETDLVFNRDEMKGAFGIYLQGFANSYGIFQPGIDLGALILGAADAFAFDFRFHPSFNFNLVGEVLQLNIDPYIGFSMMFSSGPTITSNVMIENVNVPANTEFSTVGYLLSMGAMLNVKYVPVDRFGLSLGVGYNFYYNIHESFYASPSNSDTIYLDKDRFSEDVSRIHIRGLTGKLSFDFYF